MGQIQLSIHTHTHTHTHSRHQQSIPALLLAKPEKPLHWILRNRGQMIVRR